MSGRIVLTSTASALREIFGTINALPNLPRRCGPHQVAVDIWTCWAGGRPIDA